MTHALFDSSAAAPKDAGIVGLEDSPKDAKLFFVPELFDVTDSYGHGTAQGPVDILQASHQVELYDAQLGRPYKHSMAILRAPEPIEARYAYGIETEE